MTLPELSKAEYDILRILWKHQKLSVREVHDHLSPVTGWAYTTTKTTMDRMAKKKLLVRDQFHGVYIYRPMISRPKGMAKMVKFFADRVLEMDSGTVVNMFSKSKALTPEEIEELEALLDDFDTTEHGE